MAAAGNRREKGDGKSRQGGRKKGTPNKITKEVRERLAQFAQDNWQDFLDSYHQIVDPEKKCRIMMDVLPYIAPRLSSVEFKDKTPIKSFKDELDELSGELTR